jgi:hypothetical protein
MKTVKKGAKSPMVKRTPEVPTEIMAFSEDLKVKSPASNKKYQRDPEQMRSVINYYQDTFAGKPKEVAYDPMKHDKYDPLVQAMFPSGDGPSAEAKYLKKQAFKIMKKAKKK